MKDFKKFSIMDSVQTVTSVNTIEEITDAIKILEDNNVYVEHALNGRYWCYKFQPKDLPIIICSHQDKSEAAKMMLEQLLKQRLINPPKQ